MAHLRGSISHGFLCLKVSPFYAYATLLQSCALVKQLTYFPGNTLRFIILTFALFSELREKFPLEVKIVPCAKNMRLVFFGKTFSSTDLTKIKDKNLR